METNFSHYPNPETQNYHQFLKILNDSSLTSKEQINDIAKGCLDIGFIKSIFFDAHNGIFDSVKVLMNEVVEMDSFSEAQKEIAGAIRGLNLLIKYETNKIEQDDIKKEIYVTHQYEKKIKDIFLLKEAIQFEPSLKNVLYDSKFIDDFRILNSLYGRNRKIAIPIVLSLIKASHVNEIRLLLNQFIDAALLVRDTNLEKLSKGELPRLEENKNMSLFDIHGELTQIAVQSLEKEEFINFKALMDDLLNNRVMVTNTQIHKDGMKLAFNYKASDTLSQRLTMFDEGSKEIQQQKIQELKERANIDILNTDKIKKEIDILEMLEGYHHRAGGFYYEKSAWEPLIDPQDPIQPIIRIIGFATEEGKKRESGTPLDFTKALGKDNLELSIKERNLLSKLLEVSDSAVIQKEDAIELWKKSGQLPKSFEGVLNAFDNDEHPHLKSLSDLQKEALVDEALRFSFEVNYHLANDLLNLS